MKRDEDSKWKAVRNDKIHNFIFESGGIGIAVTGAVLATGAPGILAAISAIGLVATYGSVRKLIPHLRRAKD